MDNYNDHGAAASEEPIKVRNDALEEAAVLCETGWANFGIGSMFKKTAAIRALKKV